MFFLAVSFAMFGFGKKRGLKEKSFINAHSFFVPEKLSQVGLSQKDYMFLKEQTYSALTSPREHFGRSVSCLHVLLLCHLLPVHTIAESVINIHS